jgi:hypothetical protein
VPSYFGRQYDRAVDLDAEAANGAFDLDAEQELHGAQIAGSPVDEGCLG